MKLFKAYQLSDFFKNCALCSNYLAGITSIYCQTCWGNTFNEARPTQKTLFPGINGYFLWEWRENNSVQIQKIIYLMKEGKNPGAYNYLTDHICFQIVKNLHHKDAVVVPVPSMKNDKKNHAFLLAAMISSKLHIPLMNVLYWKTKGQPQKSSSKEERLKVKMALKSDNLLKTLDLTNKRILLIDDVVTTGATVLAAFEAFKSPKVFCCYALSCKSLWTSGKINK